METLPKWEIDVSVLLIFFAREDCLRQSFAAVRKARPRRLFLWQDGPRENRPDDLEKIRRCREIVENIDWDCEVHRMYNTQNYGCDPSTFYSHKWAFSMCDKCIVLEDDVVASKDFFYFCKEMLDRYENDTRINRICGMCQVKNFQCPDSYFFSSTGSVWGWATWKRVADSWDEDYTFLKDDYSMGLVRKLKSDDSYANYLSTCRRHAATGKPHWETIQTYSRFLNSQLLIVPARNLVKNVGLGADSTHSNVELQCIPRPVREACYCDAEKMEFPLKHPRFVLENLEYKDQLFRILGNNHPVIKFKRRVESICLRIRYRGLHK